MQRTSRDKPVGLVKGRKDTDFNKCPISIPNAIPIGSDDVKCIFARRQIRIICRPPRTDIDPIRIQTFKLVFELYLSGVDKAYSGVIDLEIVLIWLQDDFRLVMIRRLQLFWQQPDLCL